MSQEFDNPKRALEAIFLLPGGQAAKATMSVMADLLIRHDLIKNHKGHPVFRGKPEDVVRYAYGLTRAIAAQSGVILPERGIVYKAPELK